MGLGKPKPTRSKSGEAHKGQQEGLLWVHLNGNEDLVMKDKEKVKGLNAFFASTFTSEISLPK